MTILTSVHRKRATRLIVAIRLGAGLIALVAPRAVLSLLRTQDATANLATRLFGAREIGYGALLLHAEGRAQRNVIRVGIATDVVDAYVGMSAARRYGTILPNAVIASAALAAALLGVVAQASDERNAHG